MLCVADKLGEIAGTQREIEGTAIPVLNQSSVRAPVGEMTKTTRLSTAEAFPRACAGVRNRVRSTSRQVVDSAGQAPKRDLHHCVEFLLE